MTETKIAESSGAEVTLAHIALDRLLQELRSIHDSKAQADLIARAQDSLRRLQDGLDQASLIGSCLTPWSPPLVDGVSG